MVTWMLDTFGQLFDGVMMGVGRNAEGASMDRASE
jgi:hypothetical protein